ncbi:hypothetical protein SAMN05216218_1285 [Halorientalis regularis]|uniref:Uncharacterized protein n=1 Tax=Halorientalis regularis TaxID=660518 RepID=A0A1G7TPS7_9EURY|nr:hypothetical protein SAMN05216218_1285 [Halorientalis regularis]
MESHPATVLHVRSISTDLLEIDICESSCILEDFDSNLGVDLELVLPCRTTNRARGHFFTIGDTLHVKFTKMVFEPSLTEFVGIDS